MEECKIGILVIGVLLLILAILMSLEDNNFDKEIKEIESILNSIDARNYKYTLFDRLYKLSDACNNYDDLHKLQKLLLRVYSL